MDDYEREKNKRKTVIVCGAGIIGCSTVYYLAHRGVRTILIERQTVGSCASGKAGGFLTRDWCDEYEWGEFARRSFDIHTGFGGTERDAQSTIDYRRLDSISVSVGMEEDISEPRERVKSDPGFVNVHGDDEAKEQPTAASENNHQCAAGATSISDRRNSATGAASLAERRNSSVDSDPTCVPEWIDGNVTYASRTGCKENIAQVHPRKLCELLVKDAEYHAEVERMIGRTITGFIREGPRVVGVRLEEKEGERDTVYGDAVVIAMGPWSLNAVQWLGLPPMVGSCRGHSLLLRPTESDWHRLTATAVFAEMRDSAGEDMCMEIYPRPDKTVYICGFSDFMRLPVSGDCVVPNESSIRKLRDNLAQVSSVLGRSRVETAQACVMPKSSDDRFIIGAVPGVSGAFIGTAHSYWGILCGPATGLALSELIVDGACSSFDLTTFNPSRFFSTAVRR